MLAIVLLAFLLLNVQGIGGEFFSDDMRYLVKNEGLKSLGWSELWKVFPYSAQYNGIDWGPLRDLVYKAILAAFGERPLPFKIVNYLVYGWAVLAAQRAASAILTMDASADKAPAAADARNAAFIAAVLFAAHPTHIESLQAAWGLKDLLMAGFGMSAIPPFLDWLRTRRWQSAAVASALLACAGMCKGVAVSLLAPLWLLAYWRQPPAAVAWRAAAAAGRLLPVAVVPLMVFAVFIWSSPLQNFYGEDVTNFTDRPLIILGGQTLIALVPYPLSLLYAPYGPLSGLYLGVGAAALLCTAWTGWRFAQAPGIRGFGILFFALMLLPYLQLAPFNTTSMIADRFNFTAVFGLCIAAGAAMVRLPRRQLGGFCLALVAGYLLVVAQRAPEWATPTELQGKDWRRTTPLAARTRYVLIERNMERATQIAEPVVRENRRMTLPEANELLALLAATQKALFQPELRTPDIAEWAFYSQRHSDIAGMYKGIYETYGLHPVLAIDASTHSLQTRRYRRAQQWAELALETPGMPPERLAIAYRNLGLAQAAQGKRADAERSLRHSLQLQPQANPAACALRDLLSDSGKGMAAEPVPNADCAAVPASR